MALIYDNEIEEIGSELLVKARAIFVLCDRLIGGEVDFAAMRDCSSLNLVPSIPKWCEGLVLWVIH